MGEIWGDMGRYGENWACHVWEGMGVSGGEENKTNAQHKTVGKNTNHWKTNPVIYIARMGV